MRSLFSLLLLIASSLYGLSLDQIIDKALRKNPSLESITHRIAANRSSIHTADKFSNPILSYTQNTLDDSEPMSRQTLSLQQKLPYFGKREHLKKVAMAQESLLIENLEQAKASLVNAIKMQAFTIWELENLYQVTCDYVDLTKQNIDLFESYTSTSDSQHLGVMSAKLTLSDLRIRKSTLNARILIAYATLSSLASFEVKDLEIDLSVADMPGETSLKEHLNNNHSVAIKEKEVRKRREIEGMAELDNYPDINLIGGYSYRKNFDNYWNFGIGISLPIYGTEDHKEQEARKLTLAAMSQKEDAKIAVGADFERAYLQMKAAYEVYHIVHDQALPQIEHMFELTSSSISTGEDLFKYIDILVQKLMLEQKSIAAIADYNRAQAKISALSGEWK